jgi:hypothetical protein
MTDPRALVDQDLTRPRRLPWLADALCKEHPKVRTDVWGQVADRLIRLLARSAGAFWRPDRGLTRPGASSTVEVARASEGLYCPRSASRRRVEPVPFVRVRIG